MYKKHREPILGSHDVNAVINASCPLGSRCMHRVPQNDRKIGLNGVCQWSIDGHRQLWFANESPRARTYNATIAKDTGHILHLRHGYFVIETRNYSSNGLILANQNKVTTIVGTDNYITAVFNIDTTKQQNYIEHPQWALDKAPFGCSE